MHHFIFPSQDTWISSGSSNVTGETFTDQNFGKDQILELKKEFFNNSFDYPSRVLINFAGDEFNDLKSLRTAGTIPSNASYSLNLFEAEGNSSLSTEYEIHAFPLYQAWVEGTGKFGDNPKVTDGCSWENRSNTPGTAALSWSVDFATDPDNDGIEFQEYFASFANAGQTFGNITESTFHGGETNNGGIWIKDNVFTASQNFNLQSPDVNMDVTNIMTKWFDNVIPNYGFILKFSGSAETDSITFAKLKFFSRNTHTIYSPKIEVKWDDHLPCTGSNTGSLTELDTSGEVDNFLYIKGMKESYKVGERVKFRIGARKRYIQKSFTTSVQEVTGSYIPEGSGSYAIKDVATDEFIVPFEDINGISFTKLSCDSDSNYFNQYLDGFYPDRVYKILLKLKYDDGQEQIFDDDFEFVVKRK
tara:strand:- start:1284 stop:2534 length:1251 start_codon:yes stop_codon:yes gene_type:complete